QRASKQRSDAESAAKNLLNETAGAAYEPIIQQIDLYEAALEKGDKAEQDRLLGTINSLLLGDPVKIGDNVIEKAVAGKVAARLSEATTYRTDIVTRRQAEAETFKAKLAQFKSNPDVMLQRDWADAITKFMGQPVVETFMLPP